MCKTVEAMRRVLQYTESVAEDWEKRASPSHRSDVSSQLREGLRSYALEQANAERAFCARLRTQWYGSRVRAYNFLSSIGVPKNDLTGVFDLPLPPPTSKSPQFIHLKELIAPEVH